MLSKATETVQATAKTLNRSNFSKISEVQRLPIKIHPVSYNTNHNKFVLKDARTLKNRLRSIKRDGLQNFKIISDFDQTLTKLFHNDMRVESTFKTLRNSISKEARNKIEEGLEKCKALNKAQVMNVLSREDNIEKWMTESLETVVNDNLNIEDLKKSLENAFIIPRENFGSFLRICRDYDVPFHLVSTGVSNVIVSVLDQADNFSDYKNLSLYANELIFDRNGQLIDFKKPCIHSYSKNYAIPSDERKNVLLIGDLISDTYLTRNMKLNHIIRIGYVNCKADDYVVDSLISNFIKRYDIVIANDGSLALPEKLIKYMLDIESESILFKYLDQNMYSAEEAQVCINSFRHLIT